MILFFVRLKIFQHRMPKLRIFFFKKRQILQISLVPVFLLSRPANRILGDPEAASRTMRYFRAKVYFKSTSSGVLEFRPTD